MTISNSPLSAKKPVTILSGFLGSGKTTLLNRLLKGDHGLKIVVMVNDFGDVNVDKDLIESQDGNIMELSGGCMCCTIRDDLFGATKELLTSGREFDCILVETSGLAEPSVVARTFLVPELENKLRLDAVITVVDGLNIIECLEMNPVVAEQVNCADLLVINKLDLLEPNEIEKVKSRLGEMNEHALMLTSMYGDLPHEVLLDIDAHQPKRTPGMFTGLNEDGFELSEDEGRPLKAKPKSNLLHEKVISHSLQESMELDYDAFDGFVQSLPDGVYRAKGTLAICGLRRRVIFHRVGGRNVLDQGAPWKPGEERSCSILFLGENYDGNKVIDALRGCRR